MSLKTFLLAGSLAPVLACLSLAVPAGAQPAPTSAPPAITTTSTAPPISLRSAGRCR